MSLSARFALAIGLIVLGLGTHAAGQQAGGAGGFQPSMDAIPPDYSSRVVSSAIKYARTLSSVDYVVAGIAGVGDGTGTINISGVSGTVTRAFLYWHGINNSSSSGVYDNANVAINAHAVTGSVLGDGPTNCWGGGSGRSFEADVTAFVSGNGAYTITGLSALAGHNANGAALVVVFNDGNPANNHDLAFFVGNDANSAEGYPGETNGWNASLSNLTYPGGPVTATFLVADGQDFTDRTLTVNAGADLAIPDSASRWDGLSVPTAGTSRAPNGELYDIHTFDVTTAFGAPGPKTLNLSGMLAPNVGEDCLTLTTVLIELSAAPTMTINNVFVSEGHGGTKTASFTVTRSAASPWPATVNFTTVDGTATGTVATFSNTTSISIPSVGNATPYPSTVTVPAGLGNVTKATVRLIEFGHSYPADVDVMLAGPAGQTVMLMSDAGSDIDASNLTFTFDDAAAGTMPASGGLSSGTFKPTNNSTSNDTFSPPAPAGPYGSSLAAFNGTSPTGQWRLFVVDKFSGDSGIFFGGWSMSLTTTATSDYVSATGTLTIPSDAASGVIGVTINGDTIPEASETFEVALSNAAGATLIDPGALGVIVNDEFTDPSLAGILVKSVHLTELRTLVNERRVLRDIPAAVFTDPSPVAGVVMVKALHIAELRAALAAVYTAAGATPPTYTDPELTAGVTPIRAIHILELRDRAVNAP